MAECIQINEMTWRIEDDMVRFFLFCGTERAALIDTGMNCPDARKMAEKLTDLPLILINTHSDMDHVSGNGSFEEFYMSLGEEEQYRSNNGTGKIIAIKEGDIIDLGDRKLEVIDIPGHTPGSIALLDRKNRVLVSGDTVQDGEIFMFGKGRDIDLYIKSLKHLLKYGDLYDEIYPMHGSFPVKSDLINKLIVGAQEIVEGKVSSKMVNLFGNDVKLYSFDYAKVLM